MATLTSPSRSIRTWRSSINGTVRQRGVDAERVHESGRGYYAPTDGDGELEPCGASFTTNDGPSTPWGDCDKPFAVQSLSKVFVYAPLRNGGVNPVTPDRAIRLASHGLRRRMMPRVRTTRVRFRL